MDSPSYLNFSLMMLVSRLFLLGIVSAAALLNSAMSSRLVLEQALGICDVAIIEWECSWPPDFVTIVVDSECRRLTNGETNSLSYSEESKTSLVFDSGLGCLFIIPAAAFELPDPRILSYLCFLVLLRQMRSNFYCRLRYSILRFSVEL